MFARVSGLEENWFNVNLDEFYSKKITNKLVQQLQVSTSSSFALFVDYRHQLIQTTRYAFSAAIDIFSFSSGQ